MHNGGADTQVSHDFPLDMNGLMAARGFAELQARAMGRNDAEFSDMDGIIARVQNGEMEVGDAIGNILLIPHNKQDYN